DLADAADPADRHRTALVDPAPPIVKRPQRAAHLHERPHLLRRDLRHGLAAAGLILLQLVLELVDPHLQTLDVGRIGHGENSLKHRYKTWLPDRMTRRHS